MNSYQIQQYLRRRLDEMSEAELGQIELRCIELQKEAVQHIEETMGQRFDDVCAMRLAEEVKRQPAAMERLKRLLPRFPGLAAAMVALLPNEPWLRKIAAQTAPVVPKRKTFNDYIEEAIPRRDAAEDRWRPLKAKVDNGTATPAERADELIAHAELYAGANILGARDPVKAHLREQRIDAIASFLACISMPTAGAGDPVK